MPIGTSKIHVSHWTWPARVFRVEFGQIEARRADKVVHLPVQVTTSCDMAPDGGEFVLPALDPWLG